MSETDQKRGRRAVRIGIVVSDKMMKTITVVVERTMMHPVVKKRIRKQTRFLVHDENNLAKVGDKVEIIESRPLSKNKRWRLVSVLSER